MHRTTFSLALVALSAAVLFAAEPAAKPATSPASPYAKWKNGPSAKDDYFPIAVWLQAPANAERFKAAGINLYIGLWKGPTAEQLAALKKPGMSVICDQNELALKSPDRGIIVGWMHGDEPDNAQALPGGKGYGPPIAPEKIVADYRRLAAADPTRPVLLNLGQGVAWDGWHGRGTRTNHPEDYAEYVKGCDIASFDIYPAVHDKPAVAGKLWYVGRGVERLGKWAAAAPREEGRPPRIVWNCIECTRISNEQVKPTPAQVRAEVWMSIIHGSRGLIYFVHQFKPKFIEAGLLADAEMLAAVTAINRQVRELAPVINSPPPAEAAAVMPSSNNAMIASMTRRRDGATYVFAVSMRDTKTTGSFKVPGAAVGTVEVIGEDRKLQLVGGTFSDNFAGYEVHLYRIVPIPAGF